MKPGTKSVTGHISAAALGLLLISGCERTLPYTPEQRVAQATHRVEMAEDRVNASANQANELANTCQNNGGKADIVIYYVPSGKSARADGYEITCKDGMSKHIQFLSNY